MKRILPFIIIVLVLGVALVSAWALKKRSTNTVTPVANNLNSTTPADPSAGVIIGVPGSEPAHTLGPATAPARLEEFGDFECPPCGAFNPILLQMHKEFGDKLQITFREFPLVPAHQHAIAAASAAEAAGLQGKFWEMHDKLYENQNSWVPPVTDPLPIFSGFAKDIGLNVNQFKTDYASSKVNDAISADLAAFAKTGQEQATPTFYMDGVYLPNSQLVDSTSGAPTADKIGAAIQAEIDKKSSAK